ncbi:unnamed protein product [Brassicogethes aeneus]|uniref:Thioredoxin domain-containing protein n=1 Tax=Brassicogethes aeneus TaxID=1431903 RepID=A0A9P0FLZ4_BRAAE|nr:unnamed protein product [Brassicogethes aeneus]
MNLLYLFGVFVLLASAKSHEEDVHTIQYTTENFSDEVSKKNHFVMFYAPWCGHCKRLQPTWEQLAEMLNEDDGNIAIAKVDCTVDNKVCSEQDVTGYPTLKFFKLGDGNGVKFRGTRDLPSLTTFINEQLREGDDGESELSSAPQAMHGLLELSADNFDEHVGKGKHFVKFYAPWCGHCQNLAPVWESLAKSMEFEEDVTIAKVDCTQNREICNRYEVKGYPTLLWIEDGKKLDKYQGQRSHENLKAYVNEKMGGSGSAEKTEEETEEVDRQQEVEEAVENLTGETFEDGIKSVTAFVKFYAPWCGHCKRLAPTWAELGAKFAGQDDVRIVKIDCTLEVNKDLCNNQEVEGFPTIFLYQNGKKISEYSGTRTLEDLHDFVKKHVGGHDEL